jgi:hypothetical protein
MKKESSTEDLGLKMGSKDMALWTTTRDNLKQAIENLEKEIKINKIFLIAAQLELNEAKIDWEKK